jgi:hypothetical protein
MFDTSFGLCPPATRSESHVRTVSIATEFSIVLPVMARFQQNGVATQFEF